ncbi:MAG: SUF system Fe-S cluster assembly regulator [Lysobacterales bacterium]
MLRISKLTDYAIVVTAAMATDVQRIFSAADLAAATHLEIPTVAKVLKVLARSDLVSSFRGANGGYQLGREAAEITVADLISAMEGPIGMTQCSVHEGLCSTEAVCALRGHWQHISRAVHAALSEMTLQDMSQPLPAKPEFQQIHLSPRFAAATEKR